MINHDPLEDLVSRQRSASVRRVIKTAGAVFSPGDLRLFIEFARNGVLEERVQAVQALAAPAELRLLAGLATRMLDASELRDGFGLGDVADAIALLAANAQFGRAGVPTGADLSQVLKYLTGADPMDQGEDPDSSKGLLPWSHSVESWLRKAYPYLKAAVPYITDLVAGAGTALAPEFEPLWIGLAYAGNSASGPAKQLKP